jgi:cytochrome c-type biogenesis protein
MTVGSLVSSGPLLLAIPVAAAAGAVTFLSPCVLPLVPGYLSYITGMSGISEISGASGISETLGASGSSGTTLAGAKEADSADPQSGPTEHITAGESGSGSLRSEMRSGRAGTGATATALAVRDPGRSLARPGRRRAVTGALLFVCGFSLLFALEGLAVGGIGAALFGHEAVLSRVLGALLIVLGLLFAGVFDRFSFSGRIVKPSLRPRAGLASAPLLGVLFGIGWTPCAGPTLAAVLTLSATTGTAARGALLAFVYGLGIGIPFLVVAFALERGIALFGFARRHARLVTRIGGLLLVAVGLLEVTGAWSSAMLWLKVHWLSSYNAPF